MGKADQDDLANELEEMLAMDQMEGAGVGMGAID